MLEQLRREVYEANMMLPKYNLVTFTWGNVSGIDREYGVVVIKPSGVEYSDLTPENMVIVDMKGRIIDGEMNPSSDTPTHLEIYKAFPAVGGVVHTHSSFATAWSQAGKGIPCFGTTHADHMYGEIPCVRPLTAEEVAHNYEQNTGKAIVETFHKSKAGPVPAVLCANHGPFTWGKNAAEAVQNAVVLEEVARMGYHTLMLNPDVKPIPQYLLDKHYFRKHGARAYYGQKREN